MRHETSRSGYSGPARKRYEELFEFAPVGYAALDVDGTIREANHEASHMLETPRESLLGRRLAHFVDERDRVALADFLAHLVESAAPGRPGASLEVTAVQLGGGTLRVRLVAVAVAHAGSTEPALLVAIEDMTELRRTETRLRQECAHRDEFMAALSHELRNPLSPIRNGLSVMQRVTAKPEVRRVLETVSRQVDHLVRIVDDLLDATRIAQGKIALRPAPLELGDLARRTAADHRGAFRTQRVSLHCRIEDAPLWVDADSTRIVQVLENLLANALKFTPEGGRVTITLRRVADRALLSVRDDGAGIPPELLDRVFEPFVQAPQTLDRARGGLGLGLATVKGLVDLHGGTVHATSAGPGRGSEFTLRLPLVPPPDTEALASAPRLPCASRRVLVVDDHADSAEMLRHLLEMDGHTARTATDGPSAVALARSFRPHIIFCDIGLPGMDGYEIARTIRSDPALRDTYLIAFSGYARSEDTRRSTQAGFDLHLPKPLSTRTLDRVLTEALHSPKPS